MAQFSFPQNLAPPRAGTTQHNRKCRPATLPLTPGEYQVRLADASPSAGEGMNVSVTDDETGQVYLLEADTGANLAASLDALIAAFAVHAELSARFTAFEDGVDDFRLTAKHANRSYTVAFSVDAGSMTGAVSTLTAPGGSGIGFGVFVRRRDPAEAGYKDYQCAVLDASTALGELLGLTIRSDVNHFRLTDGANTLAAADLLSPGDTLSVLEEGRMYVQVATAVTPDSVPFVLLTGAVGTLRAGTATDTIDVSSLCSFETTAPAGGIAVLKVDMGAR